MNEGWDELVEKLSILPQNTVDAIKKIAMGVVTKKVQGTAKRKAPAFQGDLRKSIKTKVKLEGDDVIGTVYSNSDHAPYVEFGTGPEGAANHAGISPNVNVSYRTDPWWIPGHLMNNDIANGYNWIVGKLPDGEYIYWTDGQKAQPFMYPALKENEDKIPPIFMNTVVGVIRRLSI